MADLAFTEQKQRSIRQATAFRLPPAHQELTALPCILQSDTGKCERSYPGAPGIIGWTLFLRTTAAYVYKGDPVFVSQSDAIRYLRKRYKVKICLDLNDSLPVSES
jgi:hypothetical protein